MTRGRAYNLWKGKSKYISRLKKHMYYWLVVDGVTRTRNNKLIKHWRSPKNWKELDKKGEHAKLFKKTSVIYKKHRWEQVYDRKRIKDLREDSRKIIDDELNKKD